MTDLKEYIEHYNYTGWLDTLTEEQAKSLLKEVTWKLHDLGNKTLDQSLEINYVMSNNCRCGSCYEWCMTVGDKEHRHEYFIGCILGGGV